MPPLDATICPLCGNRNQCAMEVEKSTGMVQPPCWCTGLKIDADVLAPIPENSRGLTCVCRSCATRVQSPPTT